MPPAEFEKCVANGGRIRTKKLKGNKFIRLCYPKGGGSSVAGEVKQKKPHYAKD